MVDLTRKLIRDIENDLRPKIRKAVQHWNAPADETATLCVALRGFVERMKLNCELNKHKRADYLMFLNPAIEHVRISYARRTGHVQDADGCWKITWSGRVPQRYWEWLIVLLEACARARGTLAQLPDVTAGAIDKRLSRARASAIKRLSRLTAPQL